jgi:hypothetical protein
MVFLSLILLILLLFRLSFFFSFVYLVSDTSFNTFLCSLFICFFHQFDASLFPFTLPFLFHTHYYYVFSFFVELLLSLYWFVCFFIFLSLFPANSWTPPSKSSWRKTQASLTVQLRPPARLATVPSMGIISKLLCGWRYFRVFYASRVWTRSV